MTYCVIDSSAPLAAVAIADCCSVVTRQCITLSFFMAVFLCELFAVQHYSGL